MTVRLQLRESRNKVLQSLTRWRSSITSFLPHKPHLLTFTSLEFCPREHQLGCLPLPIPLKRSIRSKHGGLGGYQSRGGPTKDPRLKGDLPAAPILRRSFPDATRRNLKPFFKGLLSREFATANVALAAGDPIDHTPAITQGRMKGTCTSRAGSR